LLARERPPIIDCRPESAGNGRQKIERDLLADVYDNLSVLRGSRDVEEAFTRADRREDDGAIGAALNCLVELYLDSGLAGYRVAYLLACRIHYGMSRRDALVEVRELEHGA
jgi:hypothetical protein